jgi:sugar phosphate isomerase/epimerase
MGRDMGFEGVVNWAAANGFGYIDTGTITKDIRATCDKAGIDIGTFDAGAGVLTWDEAKREGAVERLKAGMKESAANGGKVMFTVFGPDDAKRPRQETFELWKVVYPPIVEYAEELGVQIAMEAYPGGGPQYPCIGCTPESWRAMFNECPSKALGLCFDPSHLVRMQIDYLRALGEFGDRVLHVHGKDTEIRTEELYETGIYGRTVTHNTIGFGEGWWRYCIPGTGLVDWNKVVARLEEFGYDRAISIELEDHRFWATPELQQEGLLRSKLHIESFIKA